MKKLKKKKGIIIFIAIILLSIIFCVWQNNWIVVSNIEFENTHIAEELNGFKIVQVSDLHNKSFGSNQKRLIQSIKKQSPSIIVVTGDLIDRRKTNIDIAMEFIKKAVELAPVYYVTGNHEAWSDQYDKLRELLLDEGVNILEDEAVIIMYNESPLNLIGVIDPAFSKTSIYNPAESIISNMSNEDNVLNILLSHRPELLELYAETGVDLVFTGHAHGGQIRIPFIGGVVAPDQGFFPKYTSGIHMLNNTSMVVSRGLGNSIIPIRVFNRPEIVVVTLKSQ